MPLYIRDQSVDDLAIKAAKLGKAPNKTEAVRRALLNEIAHLEPAEPLEQRVKKSGRVQTACRLHTDALRYEGVPGFTL
ncbi:type II toxin-antitoxin system VapB family antitoxin [Brucella sp. 22210]|uniref:type II toxin-antitoxin system VapB family antitoxin n=1 Tax=Brucella sp. 22210 TaxID=3453892 RepID=UPI003F876B06